MTQSKSFRNSSVSDRIFDICNFIFMILLIIVTLYPFLNMFALSFNDANDSVRGIFTFGRGNGRCETLNMCLANPISSMPRLSLRHGPLLGLWSLYSVLRCWPIR